MLLKPILSLSGASAFSVVLGAVTWGYVVSRLTVSAWGQTASAIGIATMMALVLSGGLTNWLVKTGSQHAEGRELAGTILWSAWAVVVGSTSVTAALVTTGVLPVVWLATSILAGALVVRQIAVVGLLVTERFGLVATLSVADKAVSAVALCSVTYLGRATPSVLLLCQALGLLIVAGWLTFKRGRSPRISVRQLGRAWRDAASFGLPLWATAVTNLEVPVVARIAGTVEAGYFAVGARFVAPFAIIGSSAATIILPVSAKGKVELSRATLLRPRTVALFAAGALLVVVAMIATPLLLKILGPEYAPATGVVRVYIIAAALVTLTQPVYSLLQGWGDIRWAGRVLAAASFTSLAVAAMGARIAGAQGASLGYCSVNVVLLILGVFRLRSHPRVDISA